MASRSVWHYSKKNSKCNVYSKAVTPWQQPLSLQHGVQEQANVLKLYHLRYEWLTGSYSIMFSFGMLLQCKSLNPRNKSLLESIVANQ